MHHELETLNALCVKALNTEKHAHQLSMDNLRISEGVQEKNYTNDLRIPIMVKNYK